MSAIPIRQITWPDNLKAGSYRLSTPTNLLFIRSISPMKEHNWMEKVNVWASLLKKYSNNFSPVVLLIHPNRDWKI